MEKRGPASLEDTMSDSRPGIREKTGAICEWMGGLFAALFTLGSAALLLGFGDIREGGEAAFGLVLLTAPPVLLFAPLAIALRGPRRSIVGWISLCPVGIALLIALAGAIASGPAT